MICLLLYTAIVAPYEVCMMWEDNGYDGLYFLNNVVNFFFAVDIVINFFMPFRESTRCEEARRVNVPTDFWRHACTCTHTPSCMHVHMHHMRI